MSNAYALSWDLEVIYPGGSGSESFEKELSGMEEAIARLNRSFASESHGEPLAERVPRMTQLVQTILLSLRQSESFVGCLMAQDVKDAGAAALNERVKTIAANFQATLSRYDNELREIGDSDWEQLLQADGLKDVAFNLNERRELAKLKLAPELEALVGELAIDGYHGWGDFYNVFVGHARFRDIGPDGEPTDRILSAGQMQNRLSEKDRRIRQAAFAEWEREWSELAHLGAEALNRIAGFRLKLYGKRGWDSVLQEPLHMNRMSEATLNAMWAAVEEGKALLVPYFERKAKLLGVDKLDWHDVEAPIGESEATIPYDEAARFIVEQFRSFSPALAELSETAFRDRWIEAEDRPGKRPGGFCTSLPKSGQTRIFMTYSGTASNISTLAHELGHAYHQHVMNDLPALSQEYAMNVAETASTFAEMIMSDRAIKAAGSDEEKLVQLEEKIQRSVAFFMNIHARFLFETRFYELRRGGLVPVEKLNELMEEAQKEAYRGLLGQPHSLFWASKLHFYLTDVPFYNFPYTFGYLFSAGIYARALREGEGFASRYDDLLRDTGSMTVEQLARKHLDVDLEQPDFWREAVALTGEDVRLFLELTDQK